MQPQRPHAYVAHQSTQVLRCGHHHKFGGSQDPRATRIALASRLSPDKWPLCVPLFPAMSDCRLEPIEPSQRLLLEAFLVRKCVVPMRAFILPNGGSTISRHCRRVVVEAPLHFFQHVLMLPARNSPFLAGCTASFERTVTARIWSNSVAAAARPPRWCSGGSAYRQPDSDTRPPR